jgi:hypothetical protein
MLFRLAQHGFIRWDGALRAVVDLPLLRFVAGIEVASTPIRGFFGGRPRLLMGLGVLHCR